MFLNVCLGPGCWIALGLQPPPDLGLGRKPVAWSSARCVLDDLLTGAEQPQLIFLRSSRGKASNVNLSLQPKDPTLVCFFPYVTDSPDVPECVQS